MKPIVITTRAIILHDDKLFMCRHNEPGRHFYNLPGGKLEPNELLQDSMVRELTEETGIVPQLGKLLFINQFIDANNHRVEFFFEITNGSDYAAFDPSKATHAHEVSQFVFGDPTDAAYSIQPQWLAARFNDLLHHREAINAELIS